MSCRSHGCTAAFAALVWGTLSLYALVNAAEDPSARFGQVLDTAQAVAFVEADPVYNVRPLTVECWALLRDARHYNILIANEVKASATHWEFFSLPGSGCLAAYLPGNKPDFVGSSAPIADGKWHYIAMLLDDQTVRLSVDAQEVASVRITRPADLKGIPGPMFFGSLVSRDLSCDGLIAEVRVSRVVREIREVPSAALPADEHTVGLWRFDQAAQGQFPDLSSTGHPAAVTPAVRTMDRVDVTKLTPAEAAELDKASRTFSGRSHALPPPLVDPAATRASLRQALAALKLRGERHGVRSLLANADQTRDGVLADWEEQFFHLDRQLKGQEPLPKGAAEQVLDPQALVYESDRDPLGVILRRTKALLEALLIADCPDSRLQTPGSAIRNPQSAIRNLEADFAALESACRQVDVQDAARRKSYFLAACALQRQIALANPLLDFDKILFVVRGNYQGSRVTGPTTTADVYGQHFATQYFAFNSIPGGGLFTVQNFKTRPKVVNLLENAVVQNGRLKGRKLEPGAFLSPDLSFDGQTVLFAYTENKEHRWVWSNQTTWNLFRVNVDGSQLLQLTDSPYNDFDPCWLPNGRIAFISERRGGYIRCFALLHVPSYVLHSMKADGSDVYPLSYFETSEWQPSVNNDGLIVYTRWDYTDRENCLGSNFWICYPDGRDPRGPHGNYPLPWHTFADNTQGDSRIGRPYVEMNVRAIPGSPRYVMTAAPHHGEAFGSLVTLDLSAKDDGFMSQLKRITPYVPFPETEFPGRSQYPYGTPWPLSEDFYLCNYWENLYLLDRFGNQVLLCENALVFDGQTNYDFRLIDPIPLRPRPRPPVLPTQTNQGEDANPDGPPATIGILNVYESDLPFPEGTKIRWLRVLQNVLKLNPWMGVPMIGYQNENTPRIPLGIVPVEEDGSVYLETPVEKELIFQVLDENFMAVQSMRSVAYVHRGEQLTCVGCHEDPQRSPRQSGPPRAMQRPPSRLQPEVGLVEPITYYRLVQPVFEKSCLPCHRQAGKGPVDMSYGALEPYVFYFAGGMSGETVKPLHGGSRTIPGRFGARHSRMGQALLDANHRGKVSPEDYRRVVLWLDGNSLRLGAYHDEERQIRGEGVWPTLDVDPDNPQGIERPEGERAR